MDKFFFELGRTLRININKVEDIENLKSTRAEEKVGLIKNIEKNFTVTRFSPLSSKAEKTDKGNDSIES